MTTRHPACTIRQTHIFHGMEIWGHPGEYCDGGEEYTQAALTLPWRTGMHVGRTIYAMPGPEPTKTDLLIGVMDTPELARLVVTDHNEALNRG